MIGDGIERRLAAIMSADVAGYSRLMGKDETGTLSALNSLRKNVFAPKVAAHKGRVVKLMGDCALVEFPSIVNAVDCAIAVQQSLAERATDEAIRLRIGINLGDIIIEGSDIYGDGVNVAARIQEVAEPGGVALSGPAFDQIMGKVEAAFEDAGEHELKNIDKPVRVYRWTDSAIVPMSSTADAEETLPLPDKPSIAVLPFTNMSGDPEQEYFSDGITEDIITELSRFDMLFVIARNSSFVFRGDAIDISEVGRKLGVRYVVEGSVRRSGNRVRVTAQLIDATTGNHVWAERYDRDLEDIFAVQDAVVQAIVAALVQRVSAAEVERTRRRPATDLAVYDLILRAQHHMGIWTNEDYVNAQELLEKAVDLDPNCAQAYGTLAWCRAYLTWFEAESQVPGKTAFDAGRRALSLDPQIVEAHSGLGNAHLQAGEHEQALHHFETAARLNPNNAHVILQLGYCRAMVGDLEQGLKLLRRAMRLNPYHPDWYHESFGEALYMAGSYKGATEAFNRMGHKAPWSHGYLAASYAQLGRMDAARAAAQAFEDAAIEGFTVKDYIEMDLPMYREKAIKDHWLEGYRKAGLKV